MGRILVLVALLIWLALPWLFLMSQKVRPRETLVHDLPGIWDKTIVSDDFRFIALHSRKGGVSLWSIASGRKLPELGRKSGIYPYVFATSGNFLLTIDRSKILELWDVTTGNSLTAMELPNQTYPPLLAPDGRTFVICSEKAGVQLWDLGNHCLPRGKLPVEDAPRLLNFSHDGKQLAILTPDQIIQVWDVQTVRLVNSFTLQADRELCGVGFDANGRVFAHGREKQYQFVLWDLSTGQDLARLPPQGGYVDARFFPEHSLCLIESFDFNRWAPRVEAWVGPKRAKQFFPDSKRTIIFDLATGRELGQVPVARYVTLSPDGKTLAAYSEEENTLTLWDVPPRRAIHPVIAWFAAALAVTLTGMWWKLPRTRRA
jgi:WD40 repeat protein